MHLAWLYPFHAYFEREKVDFRYWEVIHPKRLVKVDGEPKRWELAKCVKEYWRDEEEPARKNLEFFIALRNKIEHRHSNFDVALAFAVSDKAQALVRNYETELTSLFGNSYSMSAVLRFPVFIGSFSAEGTQTLKELSGRLPSHLKRFVAEYDSGLSEETQNDARYEVRSKVVLQHANRGSDALAMEFIHWKDLTEDEKGVLEKLGKTGKTVVRDRVRPVADVGLLKPSEVAKHVNERIPYIFSIHHHTCAWKKQRVRPPAGDPTPEMTDAKYCILSSLSEEYGYTDAWVERLIRKCASEQSFRDITGCEPLLKPMAEKADKETAVL
jgi:hypothetical protein